MELKKLIISLMLLIPAMAFGQSYDQLWKEVDNAKGKDLPKTEISALDKIVAKSIKEQKYGQMLAASLQRASVQVSISPDSAKAEIGRIEANATEEKSPVVKAIYYAVLSDIYKSNTTLSDNSVQSEEYAKLALANPDILAKTNAGGYEPLVGKGTDSKIFNDDLLHVIGQLLGDYNTLDNYYSSHGNRRAACLSALNRVIRNNTGSPDKMISSLDSLINVYGDLDVCAEVAINRYDCMPDDGNDEVEAKYKYGQEILNRWPSWKPMVKVQNSQKQLVQPTFKYHGNSEFSIPNHEQTVFITAQNVSEITLTLTKVNVDGDTNLSPNDNAGLHKLQSALVYTSSVSVKKAITAEKDYYTVTDSIVIPKLPVGVWLMEWTAKSNGKTLTPTYDLYHVSNVALISQSLPNKTIRYNVVNATNGQPLKAHIKITERQSYGKPNIVKDIATDDKGEAVYSSSSDRTIYAWPYTADDRASIDSYQWQDYFSSNKTTTENIELFTDRSVYRPGQTVHSAIIVYTQDNAKYIRSAYKNRNVTLTLNDANDKEVEKKTVTTDKYGSASADFTLPSSGLTGNFSIEAQSNGSSAWTSFSVDEYKRPTFEVTFDDYKDTYKVGDTITVTGHAKTYAGVPVQGAKVEYTVTRKNAWWWNWYASRSRNSFSYTGSAVTDDKGTFTARVPIILPAEDAEAISKGKRIYHYYNMNVSAKVTDQGGESHEGEMRLPIGTSPTALTCDLPDKILSDSLKTITFKRVNMAGKDIDGTVKWNVSAYPAKGNDAVWQNSPANKAVSISSSLRTGHYILTATCGTDTIKKDFVVFSVKDKHPAIDTHDWFWQSANQFPNNGKPVYVQFGSSDPDQHVIYTLIDGNNKILEQGALDQSNALTTREFYYKKEYGDGLVLNLAWVYDGKTYTHRAEIKRPEKDDKLRLSWKTFRNELLPGQKEEWILTILSPEGKPANAELMGTLYDKSLDQIKNHTWTFNPQYSISLASSPSHGLQYSSISGARFATINYAKVYSLSFRELNSSYYNALKYSGYGLFHYARRSRGQVLMAAAAPTALGESKMMKYKLNDFAADSSTSSEGIEEVSAKEDSAPSNSDVSSSDNIRENLNESAFFYPTLTTDKSGNVSLKFTLPESVTTWKFMGLAHDADINYGFITGEAVAKKIVMVQPNMPRFIRQGDKAQISTRIFNTSDKTVHGKARLELLDPSTEEVLSSEETTFDADGNSTANVTFDVNPSEFAKTSNDQALYIARIIAEGDGFSDGEQHYLPVLPDQEYVTNTYPFTQIGKGSKNIGLKDIVPDGVKNAKVKFEYTNNPTWLMIQALPYVSNPNDKNAISLATAYYANSIAKYIMNSNPKIKNVFEQWKRETSSSVNDDKGGSLQSNLEKDQELKSLILSETPWVMDAEKEGSQKRALANYFDENAINNQLSSTLTQLKNLQNSDGSFSWWPGMDGSFYMTVAVVKTMTRLNAMLADNNLSNNGWGETKAWSFLDAQAAKQVAEMKRLEAKGVKVWPSDALCDYVYSSALAKRKRTSDINYIVDLLAKMPRDLTIYGKANSAVILAMYGKTKIANEYLQSIDEYSVYKEEMGRYFDTNKALYSWFDYKIPTQTAAIEAYKLLKPTDTKTITEMQRWLLQEKRTQCWDTPLNSANAIYAFLGQTTNGVSGQTIDNGSKAENSLDEREQAKLYIGQNEVALPQGSAGTGYVKTDISDEVRENGDNSNTITVEKTSDGVSWGAVYAQFFQPTKDISSLSKGLTVKREVLTDNGKALKVGDKVKVRITIIADRDYDFVQVVDKRAACLEPVSQLSGYRWGYYITPRDYTTNYYFDRMAKGTHVVETEYYVDRAGDYTSGTCTAQCAYSPEFMGRQAGNVLTIAE